MRIPQLISSKKSKFWKFSLTAPIGTAGTSNIVKKFIKRIQFSKFLRRWPLQLTRATKLFFVAPRYAPDLPIPSAGFMISQLIPINIPTVIVPLSNAAGPCPSSRSAPRTCWCPRTLRRVGWTFRMWTTWWVLWIQSTNCFNHFSCWISHFFKNQFTRPLVNHTDQLWFTGARWGKAHLYPSDWAHRTGGQQGPGHLLLRSKKSWRPNEGQLLHWSKNSRTHFPKNQ